MQRREFLATAAGSALAQTAPAGRPNILHIQSDQQQWATIVNRSQCRTPNLNRLAREGMVFERSYTPCAVCCPSRAMTLSGAYHWHNGVYNQIHSAPSVKRDLNADTVLYSQRLRDAGYKLGYVGKWHCSWTRTPADFGFHELANVFGCDPAALRKLNLNPDNVTKPRRLRATPVRTFRWPGSQPFTMWGYTEGAEEETPEAYSTECAVRMMRRFVAGSQPWHLEVQYVQPHDPYMPLKQYLDRCDPRAIPVAKSFTDTFRNKPGMHRRESASWGSITEDDFRHSRAHYYAQTEQLDAQIGRLLKTLDETGQASNTLVVFTTDHGDMAGAHRMWLKGWTPYEEAYRIPMIMRWPGHIAADTTTKALVQLQDLAHTYTDVAGTKAMPHPDGRSLAPLFRDPKPSGWRDSIMNAYYGGEFLYTQRMVMTDRFKYVFNGFDMDEMYDLERDPEEMNNVVDESSYAGQTGDMRARLFELMKQFHDPYGGLGTQTSEGEPPNRYGAERYLARGARL